MELTLPHHTLQKDIYESNVIVELKDELTEDNGFEPHKTSITEN